MSARDTDDEVVIDAPLIVINATGNRPAAAAVHKDLARFDASAQLSPS